MIFSPFHAIAGLLKQTSIAVARLTVYNMSVLFIYSFSFQKKGKKESNVAPETFANVCVSVRLAFFPTPSPRLRLATSLSLYRKPRRDEKHAPLSFARTVLPAWCAHVEFDVIRFARFCDGDQRTNAYHVSVCDRRVMHAYVRTKVDIVDNS